MGTGGRCIQQRRAPLVAMAALEGPATCRVPRWTWERPSPALHGTLMRVAMCWHGRAEVAGRLHPQQNCFGRFQSRGPACSSLHSSHFRLDHKHYVHSSGRLATCCLGLLPCACCSLGGAGRDCSSLHVSALAVEHRKPGRD